MHLPIAKYRERIVKTVNANQVTIITSPTGSGKTTQVPQFLLDEGYSMVVTQPRRLAARAVAKRIAEETKTVFGGLIGLNTRHEKVFSPDTRCLVATDGLILIHQLVGQSTYDILILDEAHEWNAHTETMMALAKRAIEKHSGLKLVIMSATIDAAGLSEFFDDAPVVVCEGRSYPIKNRLPGDSVDADALEYLRAGANVLVFQPGKSEVAETIEELTKALGNTVMILPLHAQLQPTDQARCFAHYAIPKCIVATPIAQTSITIDDIDIVVDSGLENRVELHGGVNGLYERYISLACSEQRRGRVGRTKPGVYISHAPVREQEEYPLAEILRTRLDQLVLRLAWQGIDTRELSFFHQPPDLVLKQARDTLVSLGCLTKKGMVTKKGSKVSQLPVSVEAGCMLLEAEKRGVVDDMLTIAAIYDAGGIVESGGGPTTGRWKEFCPDETDSDLLAQLAVYRGLQVLSPRERKQFYIKHKAFDAVVETRYFLESRAKSQLEQLPKVGDRSDLIASIAAGLKNHLYVPVKSERSMYHSGNGQKRKIHRGTVVTRGSAVVGQPWDIASDVNGSARQLLCMATRVDPSVMSSLLT